ncbi:hypothetical protein MMC30_008676 [Trapelia coarctata]|nr:hypothetical protein [Trapelia coarctata]
MKVILTGATGFIGGETLSQLIALPQITSILVLSRRALQSLSSSPKVTTVIHEDFSIYPDSLLAKLAGAEACIWTVGGIGSRFPSTEIARKVNVDFTVKAAKAFAQTLAPQLPEGKKFRFVYCSGKLAEREFETKNLWIFKDARSIKGAVENELITISKQYDEKFATLFVRPAGVVAKKSMVMSLPFASSIAVGVDAVAVVMVDVAVNGSMEDLIVNESIVRLGKALLKE